MTEAEVDGQQFSLELIVTDVIIEIAIPIYIQVVTTERIAERGSCEATGVDGELTASHESFAQSQRDICIHRYGRLQGNVKTNLQGCILLVVVPHASMYLHCLTFTSCEHHTHTIGLSPNAILRVPDTRNPHAPSNLRQMFGHQTAFCCLVEQIHAHRCSKLLFQLGVDTVFIGQFLIQSEFLTKEAFILWCHILKRIAKDAVLISHHARTNRMENLRLVRLLHTDALFQGDELIPMTHGFLLTTAYQRVDSCLREAGRSITLGVHLHVQIGDGYIIVILVLTVYINNLIQNTHRST